MLNGLADYLFGRGGDTDETPAGRGAKVNAEYDLVDDEWLMVKLEPDQKSLPPTNTIDLELTTPVLSTENSGASSPSTIDERGWNLTPPPCFTSSFRAYGRAAGPVPARPVAQSVLETGHLENLLIEHPSMSIYRRIGVETANDDNDNAATQGAQFPAQAVAAAAPAGNARLHLADALAPSASADMVMQQRAERVQKAKQLSASSMRRANAVVAAQQQQHKTRKRHMKNPSGRCNDRKCQ